MSVPLTSAFKPLGTDHPHHGITGNSCWFVQVFNSFLVFSADLDVLCGGLFSHNVSFYSFMFLHKIFTRVVCVYGGRYNFVSGSRRASRNALGQNTNVYTAYPDKCEKKKPVNCTNKPGRPCFTSESKTFRKECKLLCFKTCSCPMIINLLRSAAKNKTNPPNGLRVSGLGTILPSTHAQIADATACGKSFYNLWTNIFENFSTQNC